MALSLNEKLGIMNAQLFNKKETIILPESTLLKNSLSENTKPESIQSEDSQPEDTQPENSQSENIQAESASSDKTQLENVQPESTPSDKTQSENNKAANKKRVSKNVLAGMLANFERLGYRFSETDILVMANMPENTLVEQVYHPVLEAMKAAKGDDVVHHILFPDFPNSVRTLDIDTLSDFRFMSYFTVMYDEYVQEKNAFEEGSLTNALMKYLRQIADEKMQVEKMQGGKAQSEKSQEGKAQDEKSKVEKPQVEKPQVEESQVEKSQCEKAQDEKPQVEESQVEKLQTEKMKGGKSQDQKSQDQKSQNQKSQNQKPQNQKGSKGDGSSLLKGIFAGFLKKEKNQQKEENQQKEKNPRGLMKTQEKGIPTLITVHLGTIDDYYQMVSNMLSAKSSLSEYDKEIVRFALANLPRDRFMPDTIPFKENWALVAQDDFEHGRYDDLDIKSIKDFERLLAALTPGSDLSLSKKQQYRNFSHQERKALYLVFTNALNNNYPIMSETAIPRHAKSFIRQTLKKRLHFDEMKGGYIFKKFVAHVDTLRSKMSFYEEHLSNGDYVKAAQTLASISPGVLLDHAKTLASKADNAKTQAAKGDNAKTLAAEADYAKVLASKADNAKTLAAKADNAKTPASKTDNDKYPSAAADILEIVKTNCRNAPMDKLLTLQKVVSANASTEEEPFKYRFKRTAKVAVERFPNVSQKMGEGTRDAFLKILEEILLEQLAVKADIGKVWIDPALRNCPIPVVGRSDSGKNRTVAAGTKIPYGADKDILRAALYKKGERDGFFDFSCAFLDENYSFIGQISWNNLKEGEFAYHSGDCQDTMRGVTEIIDVDLSSIKERFPKARYIVYEGMAWNRFTTVDRLTECFLTLSNVDKVGEGITGKGTNPLNPAEVKFRVDLTGNTIANIPILYDLDKKEVCILNMATTAQLSSFGLDQEADQVIRHFDLPGFVVAIENHIGELAQTAYYINERLMLDKPSIYDLALLNVKARNGSIVQNKADADVIFAIDREEVRQNQRIVTIYDKDVINTEYMTPKKSQ